MLSLIVGIFKLGVLAAILICIYAVRKKSDDTRIVVEEITSPKLEKLTDQEAVLSVTMPLRNLEPEIGVAMDVFARPYLPQEQFPWAKCWGQVELASKRRNDGYFESLLVSNKDAHTLIVTLTLEATGNLPMPEVLKKMVDMDVAMFLEGEGRKDIYRKKYYFTIFARDVKALLGGEAHE